MNKLEKLYAKRRVFEEYNMPIPEDLSKEIRDLEIDGLDSANDLIIDYMPEELEIPIDGKVVLATEYVNGRLVKVGSTSNFSMEEKFFRTKEISGSYATDIASDVSPEDISDGGKRSKSVGFAVKFADGKEIRHRAARNTMIEALKYMGLERASKYNGDSFKGYPLVGRKKRLDNERMWQKNVDGWWVYVNMSNERAMACIKGVADMLNIDLEIVTDNGLFGTEPIEPTPQSKNKRRTFSLNGGYGAGKNRTVQNAVRKLIEEIPSATYKEIEAFFPKNLQGSYGVVCSLDEIKERSKRNDTETGRWFLDPSDILTSADGVKFTVSSEWGHNFEEFRKHVIREFGWTIEEV